MNYSNCSTRIRRLPSSVRAEEPTVVSVETDRRGTHMRVRKVSTLRGKLQRAAAVLAVAASTVATAGAQNFSYTANTPSLDIWSYAFSGNPGTRNTAPSFGSFGAPGSFDNRDAFMITGFDTGSTIPTGLPASNYLITSAKLTLSIDSSYADVAVYDGTYDSYTTYTEAGTPAPGDDPGRSIELYGAGYRNGVTRATLTESTPYGFGNPMGEGVRNVYPIDFHNGLARDVSNNFDQAFDTNPFAVGQVAPEFLNGDGTLMAFAPVVFTLDLQDPSVLAFLQQALSDGKVHLIASTMAEASQPGTGGSSTYPGFSTKEIGVGGDHPKLELLVTVVPEPSSALMCVLGAALVGWHRNRRSLI